MRKIFLTAFILLLIDQIIKIWIKTHMSLEDTYLIYDWFIIRFTENPGMAFGIELFKKSYLTLLRIIIVVIGIFYVKSIIKPSFPIGGLIALGLLIGGAIGNIIDSTFYGLIFSESYAYGNPAHIFPETGGYAPLLWGNVVDMFYFPFFTVDLPDWLAIPIPFSSKTILSVLEGYDGLFTFFAPIFNVADAGISVGILMILIFYRNNF